jgi:hypothetical protein
MANVMANVMANNYCLDSTTRVLLPSKDYPSTHPEQPHKRYGEGGHSFGGGTSTHEPCEHLSRRVVPVRGVRHMMQTNGSPFRASKHVH